MLFWMDITKLGDMNATMPIFASCVAWLSWNKSWRVAFLLVLLFMGGLALVAATKIAFAGWGYGIRSLDFTGFSGHAMRATAITPIFFYLMLRRARPTVRNAGIAAGILFGLLITFSRLVVHAHSESEAISGFALGSMVAFAFMWLTRRCAMPKFSPWLIAVSLAAIGSSPVAPPAPTETYVQKIAVYLSDREKPFTRNDWKSET